jgi:hypothetical protein
MRRVVGAAAVCLSVSIVASCGGVQGLRSVNAAAAADEAATAACSKAHPGATVATATSAFYAADQLRKAAADPQPWASMPPTTIIFQCHGAPPTGDGVYVDSSGQETAAPPLDIGDRRRFASTTSNCSGPIDFTSR